MMKSGVYQIFNPYNNKRYIGSSINIEKRFKQHKSSLRGNRHHNKHLQNAWNKYKDILIFEPLEYCEPEYLLELEQYYIDFYNSADRRFGYNIDAVADHANPGFHLSDETKEKLSKAHLGKKRTPEIIEKCRQAQIGISKPKQSETMRRKYANGESTFPRYNEVPEEKQKEWSKHSSEANKRRYSDYANRPKGNFLKVETSNGILYFPSLREAARTFEIDKGAIQYAMQYTNGYIKKINCFISYISEEEFVQSEFYKTHYNIHNDTR